MDLEIYPDNPDSILQSVKKICGLLPQDRTFDLDIIIHINTCFTILYQMGVGPQDKPFEVTGDDEKWEDFITGPHLNPVKTYLGAKVAYMFDTPSTGPSSSAKEKVIEELEWRLSVLGEEDHLVHGL